MVSDEPRQNLLYRVFRHTLEKSCTKFKQNLTKGCPSIDYFSGTPCKKAALKFNKSKFQIVFFLSIYLPSICPSRSPRPHQPCLYLRQFGEADPVYPLFVHPPPPAGLVDHGAGQHPGHSSPLKGAMTG